MRVKEPDFRNRFDPAKLRETIESAEDAGHPAAAEEAGQASGPLPDLRAGGGGPSAAPADDREQGTESEKTERLSRLETGRFRLSLRFILSLFCFILLAWIETAAINGYTMPVYISVNGHLFGFAVADTLLLLASALLCGPDLLRGFRSFFTFRADARSLLAVAFVGALAVDIYLLFKPANFGGNYRMVYSAAASGILTMYLLGRLLRLRRLKYSARAYEADGAYYTLRKVAVQENSMDPDTHLTVCPVRIRRFPEEDMQNIDVRTPADSVARFLSPAVFAVAAAMMVFNLYQHHGLYDSVAAFAVVCCAGAPAMYEMCQALPLVRASRRLSRRHAMIAGYRAVRELQDCELAVVDAGMLFPPDAAVIQGIKPFSGARIEESILDAASIVNAADGPLARAFRELIRDTDSVPLRVPDEIVYKEEQGIRAVLGGRKVVAGSRELLRSCGIAAPPREFEAKYLAQGSDLFYLAEDGRLTAMFIVAYNASPEVRSAYRRLCRAGVTLLVRTSDPNVSPALIADKLGGDMENIRLLSEQETQSMEAAAAVASPDTLLSFDGSLRSYSDALLACLRLRGSISACAAVQTAGAVLGACIAAYCSLRSGIGVVTSIKMLEFQGIWALPALLIALLTRL